MKLSDFDYDLPRGLMAAYPPLERPSAKLLSVNRKTGDFSHHRFRDLPDFLKEGDVLVLNNTKVLPARLFGKRRTGGKVEALLLKENQNGTWEALVRPGGRIKKDAVIDFGENGLRVQVRVLDEGRPDSGERTLQFLGEAPHEKIKKIGHIPLPPYLDRPDTEIDRELYQTVFAEKEGAVASPTAGLHFDEALLKKLEGKGIEIIYVTLHTSYGTFQPVTEEDFTKHRMVPEEFEISEQAAASLNRAIAQKRRILACGTTSTRALESALQGSEIASALSGTLPRNDVSLVIARRPEADEAISNSICAMRGKTNLFIYPPYPFQVVSGLITNFHLPKCSLLLLVAAFLGEDNSEKGRGKLMRVYNEAIRSGYRFYSYGDAMIIL